MPSTFSSLFNETAAPSLFEHFGERDANGDSVLIEYQRPQAANWFRWPAVLSQTQFIDDLNAQGDVRQREQRKAVVYRSAMETDGVVGFEKKAKVRIGETLWAVREDETKWGEPLVTLALVRIPLVEQGGQRGAI